MTAPHGNDPDGSTRVGDTDRRDTGRHTRSGDHASGTHAGADVHDRMTGVHDGDVEQRIVPARTKPAKTSAAATFALVFGLAALFSALTAILAPLAVLFAIIGIILGIVGMKKAKIPGVTGKGVALGGLITAVLGLLVGGAVLAGAAFLVNSPAGIDRVQAELDKLRNNLPSSSEVRSELPAG
jgi:hypothetical protein